MGDVVRDSGLGKGDTISGPRACKTILKGLGIQVQFQLNGVCIFFPTRFVINQLADNLPWFWFRRRCALSVLSMAFAGKLFVTTSGQNKF